MLAFLASAEFAPALFNGILLALWAVLPILLLAYGRQFLLVRRLRPEFSLHKSEAAELDRALVLYRKVCGRLGALDNEARRRTGLWHVVFGVGSGVDRHQTDERDDLEAHASHLRATIVRLRRLPLRRLKSWTHAVSLRLTLGRALAVHIAAFALLLLALHLSGQTVLAQALPAAASGLPVWYPFDQSVFQANAGAACFAAMAIPTFYVQRRRALSRKFALEFSVLNELAAMPPGQQIDRVAPEIGRREAAEAVVDEQTKPWFAILGVAPSAGIDQVRDAYRAMIKQNHPDRMHDLSPAIRRLAEAETKKINAAYRDALAALN